MVVGNEEADVLDNVVVVKGSGEGGVVVPAAGMVEVIGTLSG